MAPDASARFASTSLEVWRGERCLFRGLDFELEPGQMALVTGPNGSGKTSLLRTLAGLAVPESGQAAWGGTPVQRLLPEDRRGLAFQGHLDGLKKDLTVRENLEFYRRLWDGLDAVDEVLGHLELQEAGDRRVRHLSAGQRRRAGLGALWLRPASLWILDEPLTNLDIRGAALVSEWLGEHLRSGGLAVVATHHAERFAGRYAVHIEL